MTVAANGRTRWMTLGTRGGPTPRPHRAQPSNLLTVNGTLYVIDAGDGVTRRLAKAGVAFRDIGRIFISHHHDDHTAGLGTLMIAAWNQNRTQPIHVYGPPGTESLVAAAVQYFSLSSEIRIADGGCNVPIAQVFVGHDVGVGAVYRDDNIRVIAVENTHFDFHQGGPVGGKTKSYSYRFELPDRVIVFTGDTGPSDVITELAAGADLLIAEVNSVQDRMQAMIDDGRWQAMTEQERSRRLHQATQAHLTPEAVGKMAGQANVGQVVLTHLTYRPPPHTEQYAPWAEEVRKHFPGPVTVAEDLMEF